MYTNMNTNETLIYRKINLEKTRINKQKKHKLNVFPHS